MRTKSAFVILVMPLTALFVEQAMTHSLGFSARTTGSVPEAPRTRSFRFTYEATVKNLSLSDAMVRVWLPLAPSDFNQSVTVIKVTLWLKSLGASGSHTRTIASERERFLTVAS